MRSAWCVSLLVAVVGFGCAGAPTIPSADDQANRVVIVDPAGLMQSLGSVIRTTAEQTLVQVTGALPLSGVTVTIAANPSRAIGGYGVGGFTTDARTVEVFIDPAFPNLSSVLESRLRQMVAHEAHHAARFRGPGYGRTLLEAMVSEGLADRFSLELVGAAVAPWSRALNEAEMGVWLAQARPLFDSTSYGHDQWFFGTTSEIPRWAGYALGYRLVEQYQAAHGSATAAALVHTAAHAFRPQ